MTLCANYYVTWSVEIDEVHSENISSNAAYIALARTGGDPRFQPWIAITYQHLHLYPSPRRLSLSPSHTHVNCINCPMSILNFNMRRVNCLKLLFKSKKKKKNLHKVISMDPLICHPSSIRTFHPGCTDSNTSPSLSTLGTTIHCYLLPSIDFVP